MRFLPSLATGVLVAALAAGVQVSAFASPAVAASQCQRLQGLLTSPDLCVSVQASSPSVRPGNTVGFVVGVSVTGGSAASVTVKLSASSGAADITGGCPAGNGSASCWIATMNVLGSPSGYTLDVSAPGGSAGSSVTLDATASAATLLSSTPPSAGVSVPVVAPPSPSPSHSRSPSSSSSSSSSLSPSPAPGRSSAAPGQGRSPSGHPSPGVSTSVGAVGAVGPVGFTGTFPPADTGVGSSLVQPGNAAGMFPTIGPSAAPGSGPAQRVGAVPDAYRSGLPLAPIGLVVALVMGAAWFALAGLGPFRRWRAGRADTPRGQ
jgi:hypothetical protein